MGASCSLDPGNEGVEECGKKLSDSSWASEDLSCSSKTRQEELAGRGNPEWTGSADSQRAISLDASESAAAISNQTLVRSTALEDLTCFDDRNSWVNPAEALIAKQTEAVAAAASQADVLHAELGQMKRSERDGLLAKVPSGAAAEISSVESPSQTGSHSEPDICDDSDTPSTVVQTTGTAELQKASPQSSPSRKSLVPVPVFKGLFAVLSLPQLTPSTNFIYKCSFYCVLCCTLPPNSAYGRNNPRTSLLSSLPTVAFGFHRSIAASLLVMQPLLHKQNPILCFSSTVGLLCMLHHQELCGFLCLGTQQDAFSLKCIDRYRNLVA